MIEKEEYDLSESEKIKLRKQIEEVLSKTYLYYGRKDAPEKVHTLIAYYKALYKENPREMSNNNETWEQYLVYLDNMIFTKLKEKLDQNI